MCLNIVALLLVVKRVEKRDSLAPSSLSLGSASASASAKMFVRGVSFLTKFILIN